MGANAFTIRFKERNIRFGGGNRYGAEVEYPRAQSQNLQSDKNITKDEAGAIPPPL